MNKVFSRLLPLILVIAVLLPVQGQDITKGSLVGVVRDATGAIVPNAKVLLTSPFGDRSATTNALGGYGFLNLTVGSGYAVTVEAPGFSAAKVGDISIGVNRQTTQDVTIQIGQTISTVEVKAEGGSTIDLSSTTVGADLGESLYKNVPVGRNISSVIALAPGVADGVRTGSTNPSINGASGLENEYIINGANVTDPGFGGFGTYSRVFGSLGNGVNFDFIQEVQVKTGGFEAQYGQALGGIINVLTKSGSNQYHGSFYGYFSPRQFEASRPNVNAVAVSKTTQITNAGRYDFGGDLGGHIIKDKLFWYGGFNPQFLQSFRRADPSYLNSALGEINVQTTTYNYQSKLNWNISSKHQLEGSVFGDPASTPTTFNRTASLSSNNDLAASALDYGSRSWTGRYNGALTSRWVVSANYSNYFNTFTETPKANGYQVTDVTALDEKIVGKGQVIYGGLGFIEGSESRNHQFAVTSSHIFSLLGGHTLEYGYQFEDVNYDDNRFYTGPNLTIPSLPGFQTTQGKTQFGAAVTRGHIGGDPTLPIVYFVDRGNYSNPAVSTLTRYHAGFIQDSWTFGGRLTIKPGLRFEQQAMAGNASRYVFAHNWAPRIGVILDPTGNRKQKFFASWGRFYEKIPSDISVRSFSFESSVAGALYKDQGAGNQPVLTPANYVPGGDLSFSGGPDDLTQVAAGTGAQYQDEVVGGYEREVGHGFTFSGRFVYRNLRRILEDISGINVTQYLAGVPQQYFVANPSTRTDLFKNSVPCASGPDCDLSTGFTTFAKGPDGKPDGFPNASRIYKGMELIVSKRFTNDFQLYASYRLSKLFGNYEGSFRNDNGQQDPNISSSFDFTNTDGRLADQFRPGVLPADRRHQIKLYSNYQWKSFNLGGAWVIQSGTPLSQFISHPAYFNAGEIPVGGRGAAGNNPWTFPLDLHGDYTLKASERFRVKFLADLFNVGDQTRPIALNQYFTLARGRSNPDYLKPANNAFAYPYQIPFNARLAIRLEF